MPPVFCSLPPFSPSRVKAGMPAKAAGGCESRYPRGGNLSKDEAYLPVLAQNRLAGGFNKFSAMTVIDRQNQEAAPGEQQQSAPGNYSEADYIRMGNPTNAKYIVAGSIIKVSASRCSLTQFRDGKINRIVYCIEIQDRLLCDFSTMW
jgi:hypothetical protein